MSQVFAASTRLLVENCGKCGGVYALNEQFLLQAQERGGGWKCPYCGTGWSYTETQVMKLQKELEKKTKQLLSETARHDQTRTELQHTERRRRAEKANVTKLKNRAHAGICPACDCRFADLEQHIKASHPDFLSADNEPVSDVPPPEYSI